jgi:hypothetical protein
LVAIDDLSHAEGIAYKKKEVVNKINCIILYQVQNKWGTWVKLDKASNAKFLEPAHKDVEAWSLVRDGKGEVYLQHEADILPPATDPFSFGTLPTVKPPLGYDFQYATFPSFGRRDTESKFKRRLFWIILSPNYLCFSHGLQPIFITELKNFDPVSTDLLLLTYSECLFYIFVAFCEAFLVCFAGVMRSRSMPAQAFAFAGINAATLSALPTFGAGASSSEGAAGFGGSQESTPFFPPPSQPHHPPAPPTVKQQSLPAHSVLFAPDARNELSGAGSAGMRPRSGSTPFFTPASRAPAPTPQSTEPSRKGSDPEVTRLTVKDSTKDIPPELQGVSVKELVKALGEQISLKLYLLFLSLYPFWFFYLFFVCLFFIFSLFSAFFSVGTNCGINM